MSHSDALDWVDHDPIAELNRMKKERLESGADLFDLSMINPDIEPPRYLIDRLVEATLKTNNHRYAVSRGIRKLRDAFQHKYAQRFSVDLDADTEVCAVMGTKDALIHTFAAHLSAGDRILIGAPTYPLYLSSARLANLQCSYFSITADETAMISSIAAAIEDNSIRMIVLNFPNNPTGVTVSRSFYQELAKLIEDRDIVIFNDFVYGEMNYDGPTPCSLLSVNELRSRSVECYSMSKAYSIPGWRVGAVVGSAALIQRLSRLKSHLDYGLPLPIQHAAAAGLVHNHELLQPTLQRYEARARALVIGLARQGWHVSIPDGGVCVWAQIPDRYAAESSLGFALRLLQSTGVLVTPGFLYGKVCDRYVRFALVVAQEKIIEVIHRLESFPVLEQELSTDRVALIHNSTASQEVH
jgi:alanine-synthesizing transaminase